MDRVKFIQSKSCWKIYDRIRSYDNAHIIWPILYSVFHEISKWSPKACRFAVKMRWNTLSLNRTNYKLTPVIKQVSDLRSPRSFGTFSKMNNGNEIILRIHGGFGRNITRFDPRRKYFVTRWSMFSNSNLNSYEELILNQSNEETIWNRTALNFTLPSVFYSGYSFFHQNDFYFVTHSNGLLNKSYQLFKVNQFDHLESVQVRFDSSCF